MEPGRGGKRKRPPAVAARRAERLAAVRGFFARRDVLAVDVPALSRAVTLAGIADIARVDHFRAFADYWVIPAGAETAVTGEWRDGPGVAFFETVRARTTG